LRKLGFKLVPLSENHNPLVEWTPIYESSNYWKAEDFNDSQVYSKFKNVATTLGKTHILDSEGHNLYIQVLDIDSEKAFTFINTPISQLTNYPILGPKFYSIFFNFWKITEKEFSDFTVLDILKMFTFVTKTRKKHGYHIWWLSHNQNISIRKKDCKVDSVFEILTDKALCTLPPSTHRDDKKFKYYALGLTDKILLNDKLYTLFRELFKDCLRDDYNDKKNKRSENEEMQNNQLTTINFNDLSEETIQTSINYLLPYYIEHDRHNIALAFSGTAFHSRISEESAIQIIEGICDKSNDTEKKNRVTTLQSTYRNGLFGRPITGAPSLADLISNLRGYNKQFSNNIINNLKALWKNDIYNNEHNGIEDNLIPRELTIGQAKREKSGYVRIKGTIIGLTPVYNLIKSVTLECNNCGYKVNYEFEQPIFKLPYKEKNKCTLCPKAENTGNSLSTIPEYISVVDIELQDLETFSEIERLSVKVFEKNTYDVTAGEIVNITGHLHVIRKNDNPHNKLETVLFADSLKYEKRDEFVLTERDKSDLKNWKKSMQNQDKNIVNEMAKLFAPELIGLEQIKKGLILVCANAGLRNMDHRLPKRLRLNALLIGDPGLAKTSLLGKIAKLVPNSQYAGGQSSTGLSLTSQISKEDGGMYTLRFGPVVLAKNALCCINELGQLPISEHKHLLDSMEENGFPIAKYGFSTTIEAHPSIIASANPINNKWQSEEVANFAEFPTLSQIIDRFDLIFVLREKRDPDYLQRYVDEKKKVSENYENGIYEGNEEFIRKYIAFARTFKPILTNEAYSFLKEFYINMGTSGISGLPRKFDTLIRMTVAIAKLKLKNTADVDEAEEAVIFYNKRLEYFNLTTRLATHPRDITCLKIKEIIKEKNGLPILLTDAAIEASQIDQDIKYYLLGQAKFKNKDIDDLKLNNSYQLKQVLIFLRNDPCIQITQEKPMTLRWKKENESYSDKLSEPDKNNEKKTNEEIIDRNPLELEAKLETRKVVLENLKPIVRERDVCDLCDTNEAYNIQSKEITTINKDNTILKDTKISYNNRVNDNIKNKLITESIDNTNKDNQIKGTIEVKTIKEKEKDKNNVEELPNITELSSSHSSHPSHLTCENPSNEQYTENIKIESRNFQEDYSQQLEPQLQLKHSPNADIFTNEGIQNIQDSKKLQSTEDNSSISNSNTE